MLKRKFGRSSHESTIAIFGGAAFWDVTQFEADKIMQLVIDSGINHIDVAPQYGLAEERIGPWMKNHRDKFFLGCKTLERTSESAYKELHASLEKLQTSSFDLYQAHAVNSMEELDQISANNGAMKAFEKAKAEGIINHIGITTHGNLAPKVILEALNRFDLDSVLLPINFILYSIPEYKAVAERVLQICSEKNIGVMAIKSIAKSTWGERDHQFTTWYEPFSNQEMIDKGVHFALSQNVTGVCISGDTKLTKKFINACESFIPMATNEQNKLIQSADQFENIF